MDFPVTLTPDISVHVPLLMEPHAYVSSTTGATATGVDLELVANMYWPGGMVFNKAQFTSTVRHRGLCIMQEDHDLGPLLLHVSIIPIPDNALSSILHTINSSRKCMFSAGEVQANNKPVGCVAFWPTTPMLTCGQPVPVPLAFCATNEMNTVRVGLNGWDLAAGWAAIAVDMVRSAIRSACSRGSPPSSTPYTDTLVGGQNSVRDSFVDSVASGANARGAVRQIGRWSGGYHGPATFSAGASQGMLGGTSGSFTNSDSGQSATLGTTRGGGLVGTSVTGQRNNDGSTSVTSTTSGPASSLGDSHTQSIVQNDSGGTTWF